MPTPSQRRRSTHPNRPMKPMNSMIMPMKGRLKKTRRLMSVEVRERGSGAVCTTGGSLPMISRHQRRGRQQAKSLSLVLTFDEGGYREPLANGRPHDLANLGVLTFLQRSTMFRATSRVG